MTNQNDLLIKRIEELETKNSKTLQITNSNKSMTTSNNTVDVDNTLVEDFFISFQKSSSLNNENNANKFDEWKKNIEKSIEKNLEQVFSRNTNMYKNIFEKKIEEVCGEFNMIKNRLNLVVDNGNLIKKNMENFEKTERIITTLFSQITEMKCNNLKWQKEILTSINEINNKFANQENSIENCENFEKNVNNKIEEIEKQIKGILNKDNKKDIKRLEDIEEKFRYLEIREKNIFAENLKTNEKLKEEIKKLEGKL